MKFNDLTWIIIELHGPAANLNPIWDGAEFWRSPASSTTGWSTWYMYPIFRLPPGGAATNCLAGGCLEPRNEIEKKQLVQIYERGGGQSPLEPWHDDPNADDSTAARKDPKEGLNLDYIIKRTKGRSKLEKLKLWRTELEAEIWRTELEAEKTEKTRFIESTRWHLL